MVLTPTPPLSATAGGGGFFYARSPYADPASELDELRDAGLITWRGRVRKGTSEQTSHEYTVLYRKVGVQDHHLGADNHHVGADDPTNQPPNQPLNQSPTPAPSSVDEAESSLRSPSSDDDAEKESSLRSPSLSERRTHQQIIQRVRDIVQAGSDEDEEKAVDAFLEDYQDAYGLEPGYWDYGWDTRLYGLVGRHGLEYGTAKWLGIFRNSAQAA